MLIYREFDRTEPAGSDFVTSRNGFKPAGSYSVTSRSGFKPAGSDFVTSRNDFAKKQSGSVPHEVILSPAGIYKLESLGRIRANLQLLSLP
jgi:hypothetical protein